MECFINEAQGLHSLTGFHSWLGATSFQSTFLTVIQKMKGAQLETKMKSCVLFKWRRSCLDQGRENIQQSKSTSHGLPKRVGLAQDDTQVHA